MNFEVKYGIPSTKEYNRESPEEIDRTIDFHHDCCFTVSTTPGPIFCNQQNALVHLSPTNIQHIIVLSFWKWFPLINSNNSLGNFCKFYLSKPEAQPVEYHAQLPEPCGRLLSELAPTPSTQLDVGPFIDITSLAAQFRECGSQGGGAAEDRSGSYQGQGKYNNTPSRLWNINTSGGGPGGHDGSRSNGEGSSGIRPSRGLNTQSDKLPCPYYQFECLMGRRGYQLCDKHFSPDFDAQR